MKKLYVSINVDEESLLEATQDTGVTSIPEAIHQELGWLQDSGMTVENWVLDDPAKLLTPEQLLPIHERVEKAANNERIYNTLAYLCKEEGLDTKIATRLMQDDNFMSDAQDIILNAREQFLSDISVRLTATAKTEYQDIVYRDVDSFTNHLSQDTESNSPFHAQLKLPPEQMAIFNDLVSMNSEQIFEKYGPFGDDFDFTADFPNDLYAYIQITLPMGEGDRGRVAMELQTKGKCLGGHHVYDDLSAFEGTFSLSHQNGQVYTLDIMQDEQQRRIGNTFRYTANTTDPHYTKYNGKTCTILNQLGRNENDVLCSGPMYNARFEDGSTEVVFDDELSERVHPKEQTKPLDDMMDKAQPAASDGKNPTHCAPEKSL